MKKIVLLVGALLLLVAVPITVYFVGQQQDVRSRAAPATHLAFNPENITKAQDEQFTVNVQIDTAANSVAAAKIVITFDATKLEATSITNGPFAPKIVASGVVGPGTASITVAAESTAKPIKGAGVIAIVRFKGIAGTATAIPLLFDPTTFVSGLKETQANVLASSGTASVLITGGSASAAAPAGTAGTPVVTPTALPTSIITPTGIQATPSGGLEATPSAVTITVEKDASGSASSMPEIQGTAPAGSTVTLVIYSDPITVVFTADSTGAWTYTPTIPLAEGTHSLTATVQSPDGTTQTASASFVVGAATGVGGAAGDEMPTSGSAQTTLLFLALGISCIIGSGVVHAAALKKV